MTLLGLLFALAAFAMLGWSSDEHHPRLTGHRLLPSAKRRWQWGAWLMLALAFAVVVATRGWVFGPIVWTGLVMLGAGVSFLVLNFATPRLAPDRLRRGSVSPRRAS